MKKYVFLLLSVFCAFVLCFYFSRHITKLRIYISNQDTKVAVWRTLGDQSSYDSWGFNYSWGEMPQSDGTLKNMWCRPKFAHAWYRLPISDKGEANKK